MGNSKSSRVPAHTNEEGFYGLPTDSPPWTYTIDGVPGFEAPSNVPHAYSFKSNTLSGGPLRFATNYSRKVSRLYNAGRVDFTSGIYHFTGEDSRHSRGVTLSSLPFGDPVSSPEVGLPYGLFDRSVVEARLKVLDLKANILEDLATATQTAGLLKDIFYAIMASYAAMRRGNLSRVRHELARHGSTLPQRLSNYWLAYFYGVKPLISTFEGVSEALRKDYDSGPKKRMRTINEDLDLSQAFGDTGSEIIVSGKAYASARTTFQFRITGAGHKFAGELGITNPLAVLWALTPYSFVVDWIIPVENWLQSLTFSRGVTIDRAYTNKCIYADCYGLATNPGVFPFKSSGNLPFARLKLAHTQRVNIAGYMPSLPYVHASLSPTKLITWAALRSQTR